MAGDFASAAALVKCTRPERAPSWRLRIRLVARAEMSGPCMTRRYCFSPDWASAGMAPSRRRDAPFVTSASAGRAQQCSRSRETDRELASSSLARNSIVDTVVAADQVDPHRGLLPGEGQIGVLDSVRGDKFLKSLE